MRINSKYEILNEESQKNISGGLSVGGFYGWLLSEAGDIWKGFVSEAKKDNKKK
ncbi:hypothetical protein [Companilactobacillus sp. HBUAS56257]|jgi:hypothetical protein|uniref:hypothetical protein n=1 Tax=Companilactobacillus sp. HBUAS56257 TaxID=3109360 RepID=UPI002FF30BB1